MINFDDFTKSRDKCFFCGHVHPDQMCIKVKAIEFFEKGGVKRIELHDPPSAVAPNVNFGSPTAGKA